MDAYFGKEFMDGELFSEEYDTEQAAAWMRSQSSGLEELMKTRKEFWRCTEPMAKMERYSQCRI